MLLAAGAGRRYGRPKALVDTGAGPWVLTTLRAMTGLHPLVVVTGAAAGDVEALLPASVTAVRNPDHERGLGTSVAAGLTAAFGRPEVSAALVMLVDLPDVGADVVARVAAQGPGPDVLVRAAYRGRPGHPVLVGRDHLAALLAAAGGDRGGRDHLARAGAAHVECGDLATGHDVDRPD